MKKILFPLFALTICSSAFSQVQLTLQSAITQAQQASLDAVVARLNFMSNYWSFRSFKAELLPAINLTGNLMQYNHSTVEARDPETGRISMVDNNTLTNALTLSIDQNIAALGGKLSLQSYLYRLDQFFDDSKIYNSQPLRLNYTQPLFAFNQLKWRKKTEPLKYDRAQRQYLETIEGVTIRVVDLFFSVLAAQSQFEQSQANMRDREQLFVQSQKRLDLGTTTKSDVLQLELSLLNARMEVRTKELDLQMANFRLQTYLGLPMLTKMELIPPAEVPRLVLNEEQVLHLAMQNSPFKYRQNLELLDAEKAVAQAKSARGLQVRLNGELGFNRVANEISDAFRDIQNNQIVGVTMTMPIFDWGVSRGQIRMAKADLEAVRTSQRLEYEEFVQTLRTEVLKFNMQNEQCDNAHRAQEIADERYEITRRRFEAGGISVTELNTAWQEAQNARANYINQLHGFWSGYYSLRKATLYDWLNNTDITADYDKIINE